MDIRERNYVIYQTAIDYLCKRASEKKSVKSQQTVIK